MKRIYILVLLIFIFKQGQTQTSVYHPFPDSAARWNFHFGMLCFVNGTGDENYSVVIGPDTIINTLTYHKLLIPYVQSSSTGTCTSESPGYKGAIRENQLTRKVYFVHPSTNIEELLYDFNLQTGDTIKGYLPLSNPSSLKVQSIDSVLVGTTYRKRWKTNSCYSVNIIEGIGSTYGLIEKVPGCETDLAGFTLTCFAQNETTFYPSSSSGCGVITTTNGLVLQNEKLKIYPNPGAGIISIELPPGILAKEINIYDLAGKKINRTWRNVHSVQVDLSKGIYIMELILNNEVIQEKIIIQ